jgi:hypothetical protein
MTRHSSFRSKRQLLVASLSLIAACGFAQYPGTTTPPPSDLKKGWDSITSQQAKEILTFLATECDGRGSGQPGFQKAADFVAAHFKAWGLKPMGDNGTYFQNVPFQVSHFVDAGSSLDVIGADKSIPAGSDFRMTTSTATPPMTGIIAVVKPGPDGLQLEDGSLQGRIVLLYADRITPQLRNVIMRQNPMAIITVAKTVPPAGYNASRISTSAPAGGGNRRGVRAPQGVISEKAAADLIATLEMTDANTAPNKGTPLKFSRGFVRITSNVQTHEIGVPNVVALLPGSDPAFKDEYIGIGGHLDHLGKQGTVIYPGADDDGSGTTAVLSIAHAMAINPKKPKRSILFMTFCGEELGLIGSSWLVAHPMVPLNKMVAELQMDMVARDSYGAQNGDQRRMDVEKENVDTIRLVGSKRISTDLDKDIEQANLSIGFKFKYDAEDVYTRSDHYNFARNGIPIAFLFDGFTPDYHQPSDTVDKIDWLKLTNTAKLYYLTAYIISDNPTAPVHDVKAGR